MTSFALPADEFIKLIKRSWIIRLEMQSSLRAGVIMCGARTEALVDDICEKHIPIIMGAGIARKADALVEMGYIDTTARDLIKHLAKVRNEFAHRDEEFDLDDPAVKPELGNFLTKAKATFGDKELLDRYEGALNLMMRKANKADIIPQLFESVETQLVVYCGFLQSHLLAVRTKPQPKPQLLPTSKFLLHMPGLVPEKDPRATPEQSL